MLDAWLANSAAIRALQSQAAGMLRGAGLNADRATIAGAAIGVAAAAAFAIGAEWTGIALLAISAALDALDGTIARQSSGPSARGGILDLSADRVVEAAVIIGIAWRRPELYLPALILVASWYVNITVFLAVGAAMERRGPKLIEYPPGILERSEALLFFCVLALAHAAGPLLCYLFAALEVLTAAQRLRFGIQQLRSANSG